MQKNYKQLKSNNKTSTTNNKQLTKTTKNMEQLQTTTKDIQQENKPPIRGSEALFLEIMNFEESWLQASIWVVKILHSIPPNHAQRKKKTMLAFPDYRINQGTKISSFRTKGIWKAESLS